MVNIVKIASQQIAERKIICQAALIIHRVLQTLHTQTPMQSNYPLFGHTGQSRELIPNILMMSQSSQGDMNNQNGLPPFPLHEMTSRNNNVNDQINNNNTVFQIPRASSALSYPNVSIMNCSNLTPQLTSPTTLQMSNMNQTTQKPFMNDMAPHWLHFKPRI